MSKKASEDPAHVPNLLRTINHVIGENVLVFGASNQELVDELSRYCKSLTLIDIRQPALDRFKGKHPSVELKIVHEGREFEGFVSRFNAIIFYDTLHHVRDKDKKIKECYTALQDGGVIILYEPNIHSKLAREYDQFGELKDSMYKFSLFRILQKNKFKVTLLSSESLLPRRTIWKPVVVWLQKSAFDPRCRILMIAEKVR